MIWSEKYRPTTFEEYIGDTTKIQEMIKEPMSMPNFLFVSRSPGTGKTTLAKVICTELGIPVQDVLIMNSSDERKIETIRGTVKEFVITKRSKDNLPKIVIFDEFDGMLAASQDALRFLMEQYSTNCKFILTANDMSKIIPPIRSRCVVQEMKDITHEDIHNRLIKICNTEGFTPGNESLLEIINIHYPDMRAMINHIQELAPDITLDRIKPPTKEMDEYYKMILKYDKYGARKYFIENGLDALDTLKYCFEKLISENKMSNDLAYYTAEIAFRMRWEAEPEMQLYVLSLRIMDTLRKMEE